MRVATVSWKLRKVKGDSGYFGHFHDLVSAAHDEGAEVIVLPELHCLELLPIVPQLEEHNAAKYLAQYGPAIEEWIGRIADSSGLVIVGGSHFRAEEDQIRNVCAIGIPGQPTRLQEKNNLTSYEREMWEISPGRGLVSLPNEVGVTISYDAEFPESGRALANHGKLIQCVPSYAETIYGFQRVRWSCLARAIENQVFVVHSSLVGDIGAQPASQTYGSSAIIAPNIEPFPATPVLRETPLNEEGLIFADLDFEALEQARRFGSERNWFDRADSTWQMLEPPDNIQTNESGELN